MPGALVSRTIMPHLHANPQKRRRRCCFYSPCPPGGTIGLKGLGLRRVCWPRCGGPRAAGTTDSRGGGGNFHCSPDSDQSWQWWIGAVTKASQPRMKHQHTPVMVTKLANLAGSDCSAVFRRQGAGWWWTRFPLSTTQNRHTPLPSPSMGWLWS